MTILRTIEQAASELGVPVASLRCAAEAHGITVRMGRAIRINPADYGELIRLCQGQAREPGYTGASRTVPEAANGSSETARNSVRQAQRTSDMLKQSLQTTSQNATEASVVHLNQRK